MTGIVVGITLSPTKSAINLWIYHGFPRRTASSTYLEPNRYDPSIYLLSLNQLVLGKNTKILYLQCKAIADFFFFKKGNRTWPLGRKPNTGDLRITNNLSLDFLENRAWSKKNPLTFTFGHAILGKKQWRKSANEEGMESKCRLPDWLELYIK